MMMFIAFLVGLVVISVVVAVTITVNNYNDNKATLEKKRLDMLKENPKLFEAIYDIKKEKK